MSKEREKKHRNTIEEIIAECCPDGVSHKPLGEIVTITRGVRVVRSQLSEVGKYPVYQNSMTPLGYFEASNCPADTTFIISAGAAGEIGYSKVDFWAADDCFYFVCPEYLLSRFLYYSLQCQQNYLFSRVRRASVPRLARQVVEKIKIPIPPLAIQQEIVNILDTFSELEAELEVELEAELEARKQQYKYYREEMLNFNKEDVARIYLHEEIEFINAKPHEKLVDENGDIALLTSRFVSTEGRSARFVRKENVLTPARKNDVALVMSDLPNGRALAKAFFVNYNDRYAANQRVCLLRVRNTVKYSPKFLYYIVNRNPQLLKYDSGFDQTHLKKEWIQNIQIPVPPITEQERIVSILDKFDALVKDISIGLPAELDARRKQYDYYRKKLLTFKEYGKQ